MLVLMRRINEAIRIGEDVVIRVVGVSGNQVRLGIEAPRHIAVDRQEIYERKQRELGSKRVP